MSAVEYKKLYEQIIPQGYLGSYSPACRFIKKPRTTQLSLTDAFVPLIFKAGDAMQFDWSLEVVMIDGVEMRVKVAHFRLSHSRKPVNFGCSLTAMLAGLKLYRLPLT